MKNAALFVIGVFAAQARAESYVAAAGGVASLQWPTGDRHSVVAQSEVTAGWQFVSWLSVETSAFNCDGVHNTRSYSGVDGVRRVDPVLGEVGPLVITVVHSDLHRRVYGGEIGPRFSSWVRPNLQGFFRLQLVAVTKREWGDNPVIPSNDPGFFNGRKPPTFLIHERRYGWSPSAGLEWTVPQHSCWRLGVEVMQVRTPKVNVTSMLARATCAF